MISRKTQMVRKQAMADLRKIWTELGIPADYAATRGLALQSEATELISIGADNQGRDCQLAPGAAQAWRAMRGAALPEGITLQPVSGFRSVERQAARGKKGLAAARAVSDDPYAPVCVRQSS